MTLENLDNAFPFIVLGYGFTLTAVLNSPLWPMAEERLPVRVTAQLARHRGLGLVCLAVGALWSFQSLWLSAAP